ncbi:septum formation inhibitor Maf [Phreatobacter aquaticus]|uniref:Nucleoside triphosphate pyrophosphatase n=1 Tax=Phreatobacter aquaticus TaxID=2570229 RepID=A0A4D7QIZ8_9HYPH|nr:Maf family protein [Phreatobacter aquaticus]QCK85287.1 septum formation inhibitor Maf [Phreatobacter aquaticus]
MKLVLASKSPARAAMLAGAGLDVELVPAAIDERALDEAWTAAGHGPAQVARLLAEEKAKAVSLSMPGRVVIGADQTLALGHRRYSKPKDVTEARDHLISFRGRIHHLHSGVALVRDGAVLFATVGSAAMHVRAFSDAFLDTYVATMGDQILGSVGCYQFEGLGIQLFDRIDGDYYTILGMPLLALLAALRREGLAET